MKSPWKSRGPDDVHQAGYGAAPVSYPAPTYSAAKGMFESIARLKSAYIRPTRAEICAPLQFHRYTTNYGGPLRKSNQISKGSSYQLIATILVDVCYRIYGVVEEFYKPAMDHSITKQTYERLRSKGHSDAEAQRLVGCGVSANHLHHLQEIFEWRLKRGKCYHVPCLGWKEFTPSYFGPFRIETQRHTTINEEIPSMLFSVFDNEGKHAPNFKQNVEIREGALCYVK